MRKDNTQSNLLSRSKSDNVFDKHIPRTIDFSKYSDKEIKQAQTIQTELVGYAKYKTEYVKDLMRENTNKILEEFGKKLDYKSKPKSQMSNLTYTNRLFLDTYIKYNLKQNQIKKELSKVYSYGSALAKKHLEEEGLAKFESNRSQLEKEQMSDSMTTQQRKKAFDQRRKEEDGLIRNYPMFYSTDSTETKRFYNSAREERINYLARDLDKQNFDTLQGEINKIITNNNSNGEIGKLDYKDLEGLRNYYSLEQSEIEDQKRTQTKIKDNGQQISWNTTAPVWEKVRRLVATELNAAYNIERLNVYQKNGYRYVRWNLLPEHISANTSSTQKRQNLAVGVVCVRCFERSVGGFDNLGIYPIDMVNTNPDLYIPLHPYCGCFYTPINSKELENGGVVLEDGDGNKIVNTSVANLKEQTNFMTDFENLSVGRSENEVFLARSGLSLAALYLFLNRKNIPEELIEGTTFENIKKTVDNVIQTEKISNVLKGVNSVVKEIGENVTSENVKNIIETGKDVGGALSRLNRALEQQQDPLPELTKEAYEEAKIENLTKVEKKSELEPILIPKSTKEIKQSISKKEYDNYQKEIKYAVENENFDDIQNQINKAIEDVTKIVEYLQFYQNSKINKNLNIPKGYPEKVTNNVIAEWYSEYNSKIALIESLQLKYNKNISELIENLNEIGDGYNVEKIGMTSEILNAYQLRQTSQNISEQLKKLKNPKINELFDYLEREENSKYIYRVIDTVEIIDLPSYSEKFSKLNRILRMAKKYEKNKEFFKLYEYLIKHKEDFDELYSLIEIYHKKLSKIPMSSNQIKSTLDTFSGTRRKKLKIVLEGKILEEKFTEILEEREKLINLATPSSRSSFKDKIAKNLINEPFLSPTQKRNISELKNVKQITLNNQDKIKDLTFRLLDRVPNEAKPEQIQKVFESKKDGKKVFRNLKTIFSQFAQTEDGLELLFRFSGIETSVELIEKWENKNIRFYLDEFIKDVITNYKSLSENDQKELREEISRYFAERKKNIQRREFSKSLNNQNFAKFNIIGINMATF